MDIQEKLDYVFDTLKNAQAVTCGKLPCNMEFKNKGPIHLHYELNTLKTQLETTGFISDTQVEFLDKVFCSSKEWLDTHVYIDNKWYEYSSKDLKHHKLTRRKPIKR